eukprot:6214679-Pleurochrysis_carterae.AAC.3
MQCSSSAAPACLRMWHTCKRARSVHVCLQKWAACMYLQASHKHQHVNQKTAAMGLAQIASCLRLERHYPDIPRHQQIKYLKELLEWSLPA